MFTLSFVRKYSDTSMYHIKRKQTKVIVESKVLNKLRLNVIKQVIQRLLNTQIDILDTCIAWFESSYVFKIIALFHL